MPFVFTCPSNILQSCFAVIFSVIVVLMLRVRVCVFVCVRACAWVRACVPCARALFETFRGCCVFLVFYAELLSGGFIFVFCLLLNISIFWRGG